MSDVKPGICILLFALLAGCASEPVYIDDPWAGHEGVEFRMPACDEALPLDKRINC